MSIERLETVTAYEPKEVLRLEEGDYLATSSEIPPEVRERMIYSYRENPHITWDDLRYLRITHIDYNDNVQLGELVANKIVAAELMRIFKKVFEAKFPIKQMVLIDNFGHPGITLSELDDVSMAANNSSMFCYRTVTGNPSRVSQHGLALAYDANTVENPYVNGDKVYPPAGRAHLDRNPETKGLITRDSAIYKAFIEEGWEWGGDWEGEGVPKDYQHFQKYKRALILEQEARQEQAN